MPNFKMKHCLKPEKTHFSWKIKKLLHFGHFILEIFFSCQIVAFFKIFQILQAFFSMTDGAKSFKGPSKDHFHRKFALNLTFPASNLVTLRFWRKILRFQISTILKKRCFPPTMCRFVKFFFNAYFWLINVQKSAFLQTTRRMLFIRQIN